MPIVTISRGTLSGGNLLAERLGTRLNSKVISREAIIEAASRRYGVDEDQLRQGLESPPGLWARLTHQRDRFVLALQATLAEMIEDGNAIYHGYAGPFLLKELPSVLRVRLIAPKEDRIRSAMVELRVTRDEAEQHIDAVDNARNKWVHHVYHAEWTDPSLYDVVINSEHISMDSATEMIVDLVGRKEYQATPATARQLRDFALAWRVRAEICFHSGFSDGAIELTAHDGLVQISGGDDFDQRREEVVDFIRAIEGVRVVHTPGDEPLAGLPATPAAAEKLAREVMLPIGNYPVVPQELSVREAIAALCTSCVKLGDDHVIRPRFLLVTDEMNRLVGVIARRNLLRALLPEHRFLERTKEQLEKLAISVDISFPESFRWISLFSHQALAYATEPVRTIMAPVRASVKPDDDLSLVVTKMLYNAVDLLPVMDGHQAVGVILMTDVFDTVAEFIMEAEKQRASG